MKPTDVTDEGTVVFVPDRLNRDPVVLRGLTSDEMFMTCAAGAVLGLLLGILVWILSGELAMAPTCSFLGGAIALFSGGALLRRLKRNKPETWFYRMLQWRCARRLGLNFGRPLIVRDGFWAVRREHRKPRFTRGDKA